jgi:hypothetical protein
VSKTVEVAIRLRFATAVEGSKVLDHVALALPVPEKALDVRGIASPAANQASTIANESATAAGTRDCRLNNTGRPPDG